MNEIKKQMKYLAGVIISVVLILYLVRLTVVPAQFKQTVQQFMDDYFAAHPVTATWIGVHAYDVKLPNWSESSIRQQLSEIESTQSQLAEIDPGRLNETDQIDYHIFSEAMAKQHFKLSRLESFTWNPLEYIWTLGFGYETLTLYDFAPAESRAKSLLGRLRSTPEFLLQAQDRLGAMPVPHLETAIQQCQGIEGMLTTTIPDFTDQFNSSLHDSISDEIEKAIKAVRIFQTFLEARKENGPHRDYRLGSELYSQKLKYVLNENMSVQEVMQRAEHELSRVQKEMLARAIPLYQEWFENISEVASHNDSLKIIRRVLDRIAEDHVRREDVVENARTTIDELRSFIIEHNIVDLDQSKLLEIRETPEYQQGVSIASLQAPGPLEDNLSTYFNVSPIPEDWSDEKAESFLQEYNRISVKILSIHEALPGHYVQLYYANRHPSLVRAVFDSGVMIEGWAHYCESMMIDVGFGDGDPRYKLVDLKWKLRGIANAIMDQKIHAGEMTEQEAMDLMVNETFQEEAEATAKWRRAQLTSAQLSTYFTGYILMRDLRQDVEEKQGDQFDLGNYHANLLSYGSIPIKYLREQMLP